MQSPITLEALHILDAIDRRGSFAAAANELDRAPSSLSYQIQKLEQDLDINIFDRSGHKALFTEAGKLILERGRTILQASEKLVNDATLLANGWELDITVAFDGIIPISNFFQMVDALAEVSSTRIRLQEEILAGSWESLNTGRADLLVCPSLDTLPQEVKAEKIGKMSMIWVAATEHYVHKRSGEFDDSAREKYRIIAIADTAREQPALSINIIQKQPRLTVTNFTAKVEALTAGLGIGTLPRQIALPLIEKGVLKQIEGTEEQPMDIILAWRRNTMGEAKSWCIQYLKKNWKLK
ncbi:TPA: LysR family transcriptional regulator [Vibrio parahaemolyticus]|uniref:LysR family transcriptional regulator n=1 Tax=Vibrio parahaemolyticus TaxID=670 RepID=UPI000A3720F6|nr:LysR family transcriptional regulator [Vibrio parahaemolyticus]EGQ7684239.1 LysR family transcriptional regulator [Vibrio parahaemolyticus]EGQ8182822.1 LysR family transcriptional regulator [Vibrio parahaemolyticus]EGQ8545165.1 LysR family transcriptional regulator [Vibrio parahaemolyticus]EHH1220519.1 LysR family transcriptional regulator [Vibrio parahaemolyticus]EJG0663239.1 LysR family transcriptional regulator [Vibrio parahaemolyticus]